MIRVLTVRQPWASLIIVGGKDIENRTWSTKHRGTLVIHAGAGLDPRGFEAAERAGLDIQGLPRGACLGAVDLEDVQVGHSSAWAMADCWHWVLGNPRAFREPVAATGRLSLWTAPVDVREAVRSLGTASQEDQGFLF